MKRMLQRITCGSVFLVLTLFNLPVLAQEIGDFDTGSTATNTGPGKVGFAASFDGSQQFNADIDHGGSFSVFRGRFGVAVPVRFNDSLGLDAQFKYQWDAYGFSQQLDPWGTINTLQTTTLLNWRASEKWAFYGGGTVRFAVDGSTDLGRGMTAGGIAGFNFAVSSNLTLGAGVAYVGQIKNDSAIIPIITANWQIDEKLRLTLGFLDVATSGYGAELSYAIAPQWQLAVGAQYHRARFRLSNDQPSTDPARNGIGQESAGQFYARANYNLNQNLSLSAFAGVVAGGGLRLENSHGRKLFDNNYDTTGMAGGEVRVHF
jgi:hypothetical protein